MKLVVSTLAEIYSGIHLLKHFVFTKVNKAGPQNVYHVDRETAKGTSSPYLPKGMTMRIVVDSFAFSIDGLSRNFSIMAHVTRYKLPSIQNMVV